MTGVVVTGPGLDRKAPNVGAGTSLATTHATQAARERRAATFYVHDGDEIVVRADAEEDGTVTVRRAGADAAPIRVGRPDAAAATSAPGRTARPTETETTSKEVAMPSRASAGAKRPARPAAKGSELLDALMKALAEKVEGVERVPNKSRTYERLQADGKTFAYVFPPKESGLHVKIPRNLLGVEGELPKGHGFNRGEYGLTRTITTQAEATKVAASLAVSAAATKGASSE